MAVAAKYGVKGYPTIIFMDYDGEPVEIIVGFFPPKEFASKLEEIGQRGGHSALIDELVGRLAKKESDVKAASQLGVLYAVRGDLRDAIEMTDLMRKHDPDLGDATLPPVFVAIADRLVVKGKYGKAKSFYRRALEGSASTDQTTQANIGLASAYVGLDREDRAKRLLDDVLAQEGLTDGARAQAQALIATLAPND